MENYTLIITPRQRQLIIKALEKFSQFHVGQSGEEQEAAKKLEQLIARANGGNIISAVNSLAD